MYAGRRASDLPLVVRSPYGWVKSRLQGLISASRHSGTGRGVRRFFRRCCVPTCPASAQPMRRNVSSHEVTMTSPELCDSSSDSHLRPSSPIGFAAVAGLAIVYIFCLGPLDYLLVNRWLRRPWVAWITFPFIVLLFCVAAMSLAAMAKWFDRTACESIGACRHRHAHRPLARHVLDDALQPRCKAVRFKLKGPKLPTIPTSRTEHCSFPGGDCRASASAACSPAASIWGSSTAAIDYGPGRKSLEDVPVLASATKSLLGRWTAQVRRQSSTAELTDQDGLAVGSMTNQTGFHLAQRSAALWNVGVSPGHTERRDSESTSANS